MEDLHDIWAFVDAIVDQDRRVYQLPDTGPPDNRASDVGVTLQELDVVEKGISEALSSRRKVGPRVFEDLLEIG
jgi:hypothetical protein